MTFNTKKRSAIRLIKAENKIAGLPTIRVDSDFPCDLVEDKEYFYELEPEYVFYLEHPPLNDANVALVTVDLPNTAVEITHVLSDTDEIAFTQDEGKLKFNIEISKLIQDSRTMAIHTYTREPGLVMRIEHNQLERMAGVYESYPETEIQATLHYMAATKEILSLSGIAKHLNENHLGYFAILGFETNNIQHEDFPPHWHLILRWPHRVGSQAPHIYLDEQGRNVYNRVSIDGIAKVQATFESEEWFEFVDMYGNRQLGIKIDSDGGFTLSRDKISLYKVSAYSPSDGVSIYLNGELIRKVTISDDVYTGVLNTNVQVPNNQEHNKTETIRYNPLTGESITFY